MVSYRSLKSLDLNPTERNLQYGRFLKWCQTAFRTLHQTPSLGKKTLGRTVGRRSCRPTETDTKECWGCSSGSWWHKTLETVCWVFIELHPSIYTVYALYLTFIFLQCSDKKYIFKNIFAYSEHTHSHCLSSLLGLTFTTGGRWND